MPRLSRKHPAYRHHKPSGRAVVTIDGHDHHLGSYDSDESRREYDRLIGEWLVRGRDASSSRLTTSFSASTSTRTSSTASSLSVSALYQADPRRETVAPLVLYTNDDAAQRATAEADLGPPTQSIVCAEQLKKAVDSFAKPSPALPEQRGQRRFVVKFGDADGTTLSRILSEADARTFGRALCHRLLHSKPALEAVQTFLHAYGN